MKIRSAAALLLALSACSPEADDEKEWRAYVAELEDVAKNGMPASMSANREPSAPYWLAGPATTIDILYGSATGLFPERCIWRAQRFVEKDLERRGHLRRGPATLGEKAPDPAIDALIEWTDHSDWAVRAVATLVVSEIPHLGNRPEEQGRTARAVRHGMADPHPIVRASAVYASGMTEDIAAEPVIRTLLQDRDRFVRYMAAGALARIGKAGTEIVPILREELNEKEWWLVAGAVAALLRVNPKPVECVPELLSLLRHTNSTVRSNAYAGLESLSPDALKQNPDAAAVRKEIDRRLPVIPAPAPK